MLKIQNIDKLLKRRIDPEWSVFEVKIASDVGTNANTK